MSLADELKKLQELHDNGHLTDQEYADAKAATLGKQAPSAPPVVPTTQPSKSRKIGRFIGMSLIPLLVILLIGFLWYRATSATTSTSTSGNPSPLGFAIPQTHSVPITNTAFTVNAVSYSWFMFTIPLNASMVSVDGHFTATGGAGNDIQVYILTEDGFVNFKNNHEAQSYYNSGKETEGNISAVLPNQAATYYLVFDNRFSLLTPKALSANVTLTYSQ